MLEILKYIFSSFWIYCGFIILIYTIGLSVSMMLSALFGKGSNYSLVRFGSSTKLKQQEESSEKPIDVERMTGYKSNENNFNDNSKGE